MDIMMPEMDGVETLKKLKELPNFNTKVVALTADAMKGQEEKYLSEGFNAYISKPINKDKLVNLFKEDLIKVEESKIETNSEIKKLTDEDIKEIDRLIEEKEKSLKDN